MCATGPRIATNDMPRLMAEGRELVASNENTPPARAAHAPTAVAALATAQPHADQAPTKPNAPPPAVAAAKPVVATVKPVVVKPKAATATYEVASAESKPVQLRPSQPANLMSEQSIPAAAAVSANEVISQRDYWRGIQSADADAPPRPPAPIGNPEPAPSPVTSVIDPTSTASLAPWPVPERRTSAALAYADPNAPIVTPRASPMGVASARPVAPPDTTIALKRTGNRPSVIAQPAGPPPAPGPVIARSGDHFDDPWLRAMIVAPSAQNFMSASMFGGSDYLGLAPLLHKPAASVMMTFTDEAHVDQPSSRKFSGTAVVFVSTVTFGARTASLR